MDAQNAEDVRFDPRLRCLVEELSDHSPDEILSVLRALGYRAHIRGPFLCDNCGRPMADHDALARCWPERAAQSDGDVSTK